MTNKSLDNLWYIRVRDWGTLIGSGTEQEARTWGQHKASWEGCSYSMRPATEEDIAEQEQIYARWGGVYKPDNLKELLGD